MKITLRKASALQNSINDTVKGMEFKTEVRLSEFHEPEMEIANTESVFHQNLARRDQLLESMYEIRKAVSQANAQSGIDSRLGDVAFLEKQIQFYTDLSKKSVRETPSVVAGKLEKIKNFQGEARSRIYGYGDEVNTSVFSQTQLDQFRKRAAEFKKSKQRLQDEILELNVKTEIALSAKSEQVLKAEGLI